MNRKLILIFFILASALFNSPVKAQKSDAELFVDFKNELKSLKTAFKNNYKVTKLNDENKIKNIINSFIEKIYQDYQNSSSDNLKNMLPEIKESINKYISDRDKSKNDFNQKSDVFLKKWNEPVLKAKISKVAQDYDMDINEGLQNVSDVKSDLELQTEDNYERISKFLEIIIQDKVELIKLRQNISDLENKIKSKIAESGKDKKALAELLGENSKRKDLIFQLVSTIVNEHKLIESTDYSNSTIPSPYSSEIFNLLNGFMDDYINLSRNIQGDPDPTSLNSSIGAYIDVNLKLDSLYESMEKAQMIKKGERDDLLAKSHLWRNQIFPSLDNAILTEFTSRNIPIIFQKNDQADWFSKSLLEFIAPYTNPNDQVNQDKAKSYETYGKFSDAWEAIKVKWLTTLKTAKYLDDRTITEIDNKMLLWKKTTSDSFTISSIIIGILVVIGIAIALFLFLRFRKR
jgi:hypothetical protein